MKKKLVLLCLVVVSAFVAVGCREGDTEEVLEEYGNSKVFAQEEIKNAMAVVKEDFKSFTGCKMMRIYYTDTNEDEEKKDTILIHVDFIVDSKGGDGSFEPNEQCRGWTWQLKRENEKAGWTVAEAAIH